MVPFLSNLRVFQGHGNAERLSRFDGLRTYGLEPNAESACHVDD